MCDSVILSHDVLAFTHTQNGLGSEYFFLDGINGCGEWFGYSIDGNGMGDGQTYYYETFYGYRIILD